MLKENLKVEMLNELQLDLIRNYQAKKKSWESLINASVAIILRDSKHGTEFLMMQRAYHKDDPWSGQMGFPGGKCEDSDQSLKYTAIRETQEEVGINLFDAQFIGQIDDVYGIKANGLLSVHVACFVFKLTTEVTTCANHEVADLVWLPLSYLEDTKNAYEFYHPQDQSLAMPAILINPAKNQILWGLSLRMLFILYTVLGKPMNALSSIEKAKLASIEKIQTSNN